MTHQALLPALLLLALSACAARPPADPGEAGIRAACRAEADRVMANRERGQIMRADEREARIGALEGGGLRRPSDSLGERFERDRMIEDCVARSRATPPGR
ncbi:MAG: hypothetical protein ACK4PG_04440 [Acetobacteraceae bacterium]